MICTLLPAPLAAQDSAPSAEEMVENARAQFGPPTPKPKCDPDSEDPNVIVVCAQLEEQSQFRVNNDEDAEADYARRTMNKGAPPTPDVAGEGIFKGPATVGGLCLVPPCPAAPALIIDLEEIPEAPEGSDADRIGKGEKGS